MELTEEERRRLSRPSFQMSGAGGRRPQGPLSTGLQGAGEAAATIGSAVLGSVPAGLAGLAVLLRQGPQEAARTVEDVQEALTYVPRTQEGVKAIQSAVGPLSAIGAPAEYIGDKTREFSESPALATAAEIALDPLNLIGSAVVGKTVASGARAVGRAGQTLGRELGPKAAEMAEGYMRRAGMMPQIDAPPPFKEFTAGAPLVKAAEATKHEFQTGKPVVIEGFSGTRRDFSEIDPAQSSAGYFLSSKPVVADEYAGVYPEGMGGGSFPTGGNIQRSFVRMDNPLFVNARGASFNRIDTRGVPGFGLPMSNTDMLNQWAKQQGYDGVIYKDLRDSIARPRGQNTPASNVYVSFKPNYVKSAIGNRGTFDVREKDMTKADGGAVGGNNMSFTGATDEIMRKLVGQGMSQDQAMMLALRMADSYMKGGGAVMMAGGGLAKGAARAIAKAAEKAGMAKPVTATKDLTTVEDFHRSLLDRVQQRAIDRTEAMTAFDYKYDKGQRVFTAGSSQKNMPPYVILGRTLVGNAPMKVDPKNPFSKSVIDPATGKAKRTPYEPGYRVRMERGPDDWYETDLPESQIIGDVEMAGGGLLKGASRAAGKAAEKAAAKRAAEKAAAEKAAAEKAAAPAAPVRTAAEQSVLGKFGQKQQQEAQRAAKVAQISQSTEPPRPARAPAKGGRAAAVAPDVYRQMAKTQGDEAVIRAAERGEHLKPAPGGGYVGAPRTVTSPQALGAMRRAMDKDFIDSVEAVRLADPDRLGTWYDRAKAGIAQSSEPYQLNRTLDQHSVYSAGVSPESELGFSLKHLNSRVAGQPERAYRGPGMRTLDTAVAEDRPAKLAFKVGEYREKNDPRVPNTGLFGVNDFRRAQGTGYTDPEGKPWKAGVTATMHPFMDAETALQVSRANRAGIGGRTDWQGPHIQELPWVYGKAQDLYSRGQRGRFAGDPLEGMKSSIREANKTAQDYMYKHAASATHEAIPGASLGHVRQALDMTPEQKLAYGRKGRWDQPAPEAKLNPLPQVGAGNRDVLYGAAGYRQLPSREAQGLYTNKLGQVETNPMTIARPLMDFPTGGGGGLASPNTRKVAETLEQLRAFMDAQEAGAYNLPNTMSQVKGKTSMVLDTRGRLKDKADPSAGALPTSQQLAQMDSVLKGTGFGVSATNRGAVVFPYDPTMDPKQAQKILRQKRGALTSIFPSEPQMSMTTTGYVPGVGKRGQFGPESTAPFSGEATSDVLRAFAELEPSVSLNVSESEAVRQAIRDKALRDSLMGGTRRDIQESRRFFSEADWPRAVEMIRQGMSPAAALAALGYSASSMAEEGR